MEVSNSSGSDTQYRTASGAPKYSGSTQVWVVPAGGMTTVPDPVCPFTVEFLIDGQVVLTTTCDQPLRRITFMKPGRSGKYRVRRYKQPPQPARRRAYPAGDGPRTSPPRA